MNLYAYVGSDPINYFDSLGLFEWPWKKKARLKRERQRREKRKRNKVEADKIMGNPEVQRQISGLLAAAAIQPGWPQWEYTAACYYCCESGTTVCFSENAKFADGGIRGGYQMNHPKSKNINGEVCKQLVNMHLHENGTAAPSGDGDLMPELLGGPNRPFIVIGQGGDSSITMPGNDTFYH